MAAWSGIEDDRPRSSSGLSQGLIFQGLSFPIWKVVVTPVSSCQDLGLSPPLGLFVDCGGKVMTMMKVSLGTSHTRGQVKDR